MSENEPWILWEANGGLMVGRNGDNGIAFRHHYEARRVQVALNALEQAKADAERERERFREGLEQIGCLEAAESSDDYNRAWHEAAAYANKVIDGTIGSTLDYVIAQQDAAEVRATQANTRNLDLQAQLAAAVEERDELRNQRDQDWADYRRVWHEKDARAQRYREALEAIRDEAAKSYECSTWYRLAAAALTDAAETVLDPAPRYDAVYEEGMKLIDANDRGET